MRILEVHLKNIKSHEDSRFSFSPGINVLSGPNGAGKSTVFEAIGYALFGVDARDFVANIERFLRIGSKKGEVQVVFEGTDGGRYRAGRTVGGGAKWLLAGESNGAFEIEEHAGSAETEARIAGLLGLSAARPLKEQFKQIIGPFQNDFLGPFVIRSATERQKTFDHILGIDSWRRAFEGTRELQRELSHRSEQQALKLEALRDRTRELPPLRRRSRELQKELDRIAAALGKLRGAQQQAEAALEALDRQETLLRALEQRLATLAESLKSGSEHITNQQALVAAGREAEAILQKHLPGKQSFDAAEERLVQLRERQKEQRRREDALRRTEHEIEQTRTRLRIEGTQLGEHQARLDAAREELAREEARLRDDAGLRQLADRLPELRRELESLQSRLGQLQGRRDGLKEGQEKLGEGICPFFGEPCLNLAGKHTEDFFEGRIQDLERERALLEESRAGVRERIVESEGAERESIRRRDRLGRIAQERSRLAEDEAALKKKREELACLEAPLASRLEALEEQRSALLAFEGLETQIEQQEAIRKKHAQDRDLVQANARLAGELSRHLQKLERYRARLGELETRRKEAEDEQRRLRADYDPREHERLRMQQRELDREKATLEQRERGERQALEELSGRIKLLRALLPELARLRRQQRRFKRASVLLDYLRTQVFKQVSAKLSERFRAEISRRADRIYRTISGAEEELLWGEGYQVCLVDFKDGQRRERSDDQLSGGQMMSAVVALRLALLQSLGARIAFFDEPTSNLDAGRRENLARAFRAIDEGQEDLAEHWYDQLFLISHDVAFTEITNQLIELEN